MECDRLLVIRVQRLLYDFPHRVDLRRVHDVITLRLLNAGVLLVTVPKEGLTEWV